MNAKTLLIIAVLFAAYTFAIWKWSESNLRGKLLSQDPPRDTTLTIDTGRTPLPVIRDSIDVAPGAPAHTIHDTIPDNVGIDSIRAILARKDSILAWLSAPFAESLGEYGHTLHLAYRPEIRRLYYDWIPPLPVTTTQTIVETRYLPEITPLFWLNLHAGGRVDRLSWGLTLGVGPIGLTRIMTVGEKPLTLATVQLRPALSSLFAFVSGRQQ